MELEDAAVSGVGVDHQVAVRQAPGQVERVRGGHHPVALAVGDEHGLVDAGQVLRSLETPAVDRGELGEVGLEGDCLVPVVGAFLQAGQELLARLAAVARSGEEEELLRVLQREQGPDGVEVRELGDVCDAFAAGGSGAGEDQLADELGFVLDDHLGDHAAHGEAQQVDLGQAQRPDEGDRVFRHRLNALRHRAGGGADAPVVERDDPVFRGEAVDDPGSQLSRTAARCVTRTSGTPAFGPGSR